MRPERKRPRVTYVIRQLGRGGSEKRLYEFLRYSYPDEVEPQVIAFEGGAYEAKMREIGVSVINLGAVGRQPITRLQAIISQLCSFRPDIVHGMDSGGFYGRAAAKWLQVPVILSGFNGSHLPNRIFCWIEYVLSHVTDCVISNSYAGKHYLINTVRVNPCHIRVIPNGFDFEAASAWEPHNLHRELGLDPTQPIVGQVARLVDVKNPSMFVEAAAKVHRHVPHAHFVIVGSGPLQPQIEALAAARGIGPHLTLLGERPDAANLIPSFTVGVLTSRTEGLPNTLLEYMFWARPCVVTDVGDCGRVVKHGETGFVVSPTDVGELTNRLVYLLNNSHEAARLGQSAREYLEQEFGLVRYCHTLLALYHEILGRRCQTH